MLNNFYIGAFHNAESHIKRLLIVYIKHKIINFYFGYYNNQNIWLRFALLKIFDNHFLLKNIRMKTINIYRIFLFYRGGRFDPPYKIKIKSMLIIYEKYLRNTR
jgi:hypothetical protein